MANIVPAILSQSWGDIEDKIKIIEDLVEWVQIDIADGRFVSNLTWNIPTDLEVLPGKIKIEAHLMVEKPEDVIIDWINVVDRIVIHLESTDKLEDIVDSFQSTTTKLVLALDVETSIEDVLPYADKVAAIQLMGIKKVGFQGEKFDPLVLEKIKELRAKAPNAKIQVDGGVNLETGRDAVAAGADTLIVGSALWESGDVEGTIEKFKAL